jgi:hypothetical protein
MSVNLESVPCFLIVAHFEDSSPSSSHKDEQLVRQQ